ncbi:hypothetical protein C8D88_101736 [Lentzea atacamensis]|uniref:Uncharacterized protein n=1 Tax=Lentzea atacamensis TaxID=531938 RepID=A0A316IDQ3_9PSEU|nr:hypothetical protein [Lentzea atacamensis]PWK90716.1 hypothetical protein C8D88_101736 [Lentzea atacamensis]
MNPELRSRLLHLNADRLLPSQAVWLACDLLVAGIGTPAVVELAGESPAGLLADDAELLADRVLAELGIPRLNREQVELVECRELALDVISGELAPEHWACCIWPLGRFWRGDDLDTFRAMAVHDPAEVSEDVLEYAREFVRIADERLRVWLP